MNNTLDQLKHFFSSSTDEALDLLPFGAIKLDSAGRVLSYNSAEGQLTGVRPEQALGKLFFDEIAPCTKTPSFYGRFVIASKARHYNAMFEYLFQTEQWQMPVQIHMFSDSRSNGDIAVMLVIKRTHAVRSLEFAPTHAVATSDEMFAETESASLFATTEFSATSSCPLELNDHAQSQFLEDTARAVLKSTGLDSFHVDILKL